jgi:hypothetical protein
MLAWYAMLILATVGIVATFKRDWRRLFLPLLFTAGLILVLALVEGNVGTIFRHRSMLMPTTFIGAGIGLTWLLAQRARAADRSKIRTSS